MGRYYVRKSKRGSYKPENLTKALADLREGQSYRSVSKKYDVPRRTLQRHFKGLVREPGCTKLGRFRSILSDEMESELVSHAIDMQQRFYGLTPADIRRLAFQLVENKKLPHPFNSDKKMAGNKWLLGFIERHPQLSIREPEATSMSRAVAFNRPQVSRFFDILKSLLEKDITMDGSRIWNMDESGVTAVHKPGRIIAKKGSKQVGKITSGERGKTVTVLCAVNAHGSYLPPAMIYPRVRMNQQLLKGAPPGTIGFATKSGWTDSDVFVKWLQHFADFVKPTLERKVLLLLDGHASHKSLEAITFARNHGIDLISFPPHCTHKIQPLDLTFFGPLKGYYRSECDKWMVSNPGKRISFFEIAEIFGTAYIRCATIDKGVSGFRSGGIWPYNCDVFTDADFAPAMMTENEMVNDEPAAAVNTNDEPATALNLNDEPATTVNMNDEPTTTVNMNDEPATTVNMNDEPATTVNMNDEPATTVNMNDEPATTVNMNDEPATTVNMNDEPTTTVNMNDEPATTVNMNDEPATTVNMNDEPATTVNMNDEPTTTVNMNDEPATTVNMNDEPATTVNMNDEPATTTSALSPIQAIIQALSPLPKAQARSGKRKAETSQILTSTPFKRVLLEKQQTQQLKIDNKARRSLILQEKKAKKTVADNTPVRAKKALPKSSSVNKKKKTPAKKKIVRDDKRRPSKTNNIVQKKKSVLPKKNDITKSKTKDNDICPGCDEIGGTEEWIRCSKCKLWWHEECTSYEGSGKFTCDLCK